MNLTQEQLTKAKSAKSVEELLALAKENGVELTEDEAKKYFAEWHREGELSDDELQNVSGGCGGPKEYETYPGAAPTCGGKFIMSDEAPDSSWRCGNCYFFESWSRTRNDAIGKCMREVKAVPLQQKG